MLDFQLNSILRASSWIQETFAEHIYVWDILGDMDTVLHGHGCKNESEVPANYYFNTWMTWGQSKYKNKSHRYNKVAVTIMCGE